MAVAAQKEGYEPAQTSISLTVKAAVRWMLYGGIAGVVVIVMAAVVVYLVKRRS